MLTLLSTVALAAPCDLSKSGEVSKLLSEIPATQRTNLAATWLSEACTLPAALDAAMGELAAVDPQFGRMVVAKAAADDPVLLVAACAGGPGVVAQSIQVAPSESRGVLYDGCGLKRHGLVDRAAFVAATTGDPLLFTLAAQALAPVSADPGVRSALRALAGVE